MTGFGSTGSRSVRVFVSSTFRDMQEERDLLAKRVFPEIRERCAARGIEFVEVDLRWGVTEAEAENQEVLAVCLREIDHCRPYFIGLLGERYGTVLPPPDEVVGEHPWVGMREGSSVTELEILHGALLDAASADRAFFYLRSAHYLAEVPANARSDFEIEDEESKAKLDGLKEQIRTGGFRLVDGYDTPAAVCDHVLKDVTDAIAADFPERLDLDPHDIERGRHEAFGSSVRSLYVGREREFEVLDQYDEGGRLCVVGPAGVGKTSLLANWIENRRGRDGFVFEHYVGASAESSQVSAMRERLLAELQRHYGLDLASRSEDQGRDLARALNRAAQKAPLLLVIDGVDRMADVAGHPLDFLPAKLPPHMAVIVSGGPRTIDDDWTGDWATLELGEMSRSDRRTFVIRYLHERYRKKLAPEQVQRIAGAHQTANALFLRTLLEELRLFGDHDRIDERLDAYLEAPDLADLLQEVIGRCSDDFDPLRPDLVRDALSLIWASRRGLREAQLLALLGSDGARLPARRWSPAFRALESSVLWRTDVIALSGDSARQAVEASFLEDAGARRLAHRRLADFVDDRREGDEWIVELAWQLSAGSDLERLEQHVSDPEVIEHYLHRDGLRELERYWAQLGDRFVATRDLPASYQRLAAGGDDARTADLALRVGELLGRFGHWETAEGVLEDGLTRSVAAHGWGHASSVRLLSTLGRARSRTGDTDGSRRLLLRSLAIALVDSGPESATTQETSIRLAQSFEEEGELERAESILRDVQATFASAQRGDVESDALYARAIDRLAGLRRKDGDHAEAERLHREALAIFESSHGDDHPETAGCRHGLADVLIYQRRHAEAEPLLEAALRVREVRLGADHIDTGGTWRLIGQARAGVGKLEEARAAYEEAARVLELRLGPDSLPVRNVRRVLDRLVVPEAGQSARDWLDAASAAVDASEVERLLRQAIAAAGASGEDGVMGARARLKLGLLLQSVGRPDEAEAFMTEAASLFDALPAGTPVDRLWVRLALADLAVSRGDARAPLELARETLESMASSLAGDPERLAHAYARFGVISRNAEDGEAAVWGFRRAADQAEAGLPADHSVLLDILSGLAESLSDVGNFEEAERIHRRVLGSREAALPTDDPLVLTTLGKLGFLVLKREAPDEAIPLLRRAVRGRRPSDPEDVLNMARDLQNLAAALRMADRREEAIGPFEQALAVLETHGLGRTPVALRCRASLGAALLQLARYEEAEVHFDGWLETVEEAVGPAHGAIVEPLGALAQVAADRGRFEEASSRYRRVLSLLEGEEASRDREIAVCLTKLASALEMGGDPLEARRCLDRAAETLTAAFGDREPVLGVVQAERAALDLRQKSIEDAERRGLRAIELLDGTTDFDVSLASAWETLAGVRAERSEHAAAAQALDHAIELKNRVSGPDDPAIASLLLDQVKNWLEVDERDHAQASLQRHDAILESARSRQDPRAVGAFFDEARRWHALERWDRAVRNYQTVIELIESSRAEGQYGRAPYLSIAGSAHLRIGKIRGLEGNIEAAERRLEAATRLYTEAGDVLAAAGAELTRQSLYVDAGREADAERITELVEVFEAHADPRAEEARALLRS